jgi:hypothetical protein
VRDIDESLYLTRRMGGFRGPEIWQRVTRQKALSPS